jgi:hypothetical protein
MPASVFRARHDSGDDLLERDSAAVTGTPGFETSQVTTSIVTFSAGLGGFVEMVMTLRPEIWRLDKQIFRLAPPAHRGEYLHDPLTCDADGRGRCGAGCRMHSPQLIGAMAS